MTFPRLRPALSAALGIALSLAVASSAWADSRADESAFLQSDWRELGVDAIVCREADGKIKSVRTLDLVEGPVEKLEALASQYGDKSEFDFIDRSLNLLRNVHLEFIDGALWDQLDRIDGALDFVPEEEAGPRDPRFDGLAKIHTWLVPEKDCVQEPLAIYDRAIHRFVVRERLSKNLSKLETAAMLLHLASYSAEMERVAPWTREGTSDRTRGFVRTLLLADKNNSALADEILEASPFRLPLPKDEAASFARKIRNNSLKPVPCAQRACVLEDFEGAYLLVGRGGAAECERAMYLDINGLTITAIYNIVQEPMLTELARQWPRFPGLTRKFSRLFATTAIHSSDAVRIRLSNSIDGYKIVLKSRIKEFSSTFPLVKWFLPKTRHTQLIELVTQPDGRLKATLSGDVNGACLYERREL